MESTCVCYSCSSAEMSLEHRQARVPCDSVMNMSSRVRRRNQLEKHECKKNTLVIPSGLRNYTRPLATNGTVEWFSFRTRTVLVTWCVVLMIFGWEMPLSSQLPLSDLDKENRAKDIFDDTSQPNDIPDSAGFVPNSDEMIVYPRVQRTLRRRRRSSSEQFVNSDEENTEASVDKDYTVSTSIVMTILHNSSSFYLELQPHEDILGSDFSAVVRTDDNEVSRVDVSDLAKMNEECLYKGKIVSHQGGRATVSMCNDDGRMYGMMVTENGSSYLLRPLLTHRQRRDAQDGPIPHILFKDPAVSEDFCTVGKDHVAPRQLFRETSDNAIFEVNGRRKREAEDSSVKIIETAIFIDKAMHDEYDRKYANENATVREICKITMAMLTEVQLIYEYKSMNTPIKIVIVRLEIIKSASVGPKTANGDIDKYLDNFCFWQARKNRQQVTNKWDHALMLTGLDLYKATGNSRKNYKVLGLAWVNGMCRAQYSCTLNEGKSFEAAFVIAHELGHSLGIQHDGRGNNCDPDKYIMSEKTGGGKINWSSCSNKYLEEFFSRGSGRCLSNSADPMKDFDLEKDSTLPGESYPPREQCRLALGMNFRPYVSSVEPFNDICHELWCVSGSWAKPAHPALEGSECGDSGRCIQGRCSRDTRTRRRDTRTESRGSTSLRRSAEEQESESSSSSSGVVEKVKRFFRRIYSRLRGMTASLLSGR